MVEHSGRCSVADCHDDKLHAMDEYGKLAVGLARVEVANGVRTRVKNDVILEMAIAEVTDTLYVFVEAPDNHSATTYTSELFNVTWDLACAAHKPHLDIKIVSPQCSPLAWDDLLYLPELSVVYGELATASHDTKWLPRGQHLPVPYRSPALKLQAFFDRGVSYFNDDDDDRSGMKHPVVIVNGTFDHLHNGHRKLLTLAASVCSERLLIGITAAQPFLDAMPYAELFEPLETRKHKVLAFVTSLNSALCVEVVEVVDLLGPSANSTDNRVLVVGSTSDVERIQELRAWRGTLNLAWLLTRLVRRTHRSTLSSSRLRQRIAAHLQTAP